MLEWIGKDPAREIAHQAQEVDVRGAQGAVGLALSGKLYVSK